MECIKSQGEGQINDHEVLKTMAKSSAHKVRSDPHLTKCWSEYQFFMGHLIEAKYTQLFTLFGQGHFKFNSSTPAEEPEIAALGKHKTSI